MTHRSPTRIMLVDTRPESLFAFANELTGIGFGVTPASGVDQAMEIAEREVFDVLVCKTPLDLGEPALLLRFLRRSKRLRQVRLVVKDSCQCVGVRLSEIAGEPIYSICNSLPVEVVGCIIKHAQALPVVRPKFPSSPAPVPHFWSAESVHPTVRAS